MNKLAKDIMRLAQEERSYVVGLLRRLIRTPSLSRREGELVDLIKYELEEIGIDEVVIDSIGNITGRVGEGRPLILYDSHIDTVDVGDLSKWRFDPFEAKVENGIIYGRGASDNKAGIACMIAALKVIKRLGEPIDFSLLVAGIVQEEDCEGLALSVLLDEEGLSPDCVVIGECTNLGINRGHRGRAEIEITTKGRSCHASVPERGENAIYKMAPIIESIKWMGDNLRSHPFLGKGTIAVTKVECVTPSVNAVPDLCRIFIDRRTVPQDTKESITRELDEIVRFAGASVTLCKYTKASYKGYVKPYEKFFPAWVLDESSPVIKVARSTYNLLFEKDPNIGKWDFSTDGNYSMGIKSIPTIGFGPGEEKYAHTTEDQVRAEDLWKSVAFYSLFPFVYRSEGEL